MCAQGDTGYLYKPPFLSYTYIPETPGLLEGSIIKNLMLGVDNTRVSHITSLNNASHLKELSNRGRTKPSVNGRNHSQNSQIQVFPVEILSKNDQQTDV